MSFNVKRQLLGAAGAGGGGAYFIAKWQTPYDPNKRNTIHGVVDSSDKIYVDFDYTESGSTRRTGVMKFDNAGTLLADRYLTGTVAREPFCTSSVFNGTWQSAVDSTNGKLGVVVKSNSFYANLIKLNTSDLTFSSGNVNSFVTGNTWGFHAESGNSYQIGGAATGNPLQGFVAKYNSSNTQQWSRDYQFYNPYYDQIGAQFIGGYEDSSGNVYAGGLYPRSNWDSIVMKLNSSGSPQWYVSRNDDQNSSLPIIRADSSGNVYVGGILGINPQERMLFYVAKYNSSGTFQWDYILQSSLYKGAVQSIDLDSSGNVYVAGTISRGSGNFSTSYRNIGVVAKFNSSGTLQWQRGIGPSTANVSVGQDKYTTVRIDSNDDMVITTCEPNGNYPFFYLLRLPNDGSLTGTYSTVAVKYDSTSFSDTTYGSSTTVVSAGDSPTTTTSLTNSVGSTDISYSITSETL